MYVPREKELGGEIPIKLIVYTPAAESGFETVTEVPGGPEAGVADHVWAYASGTEGNKGKICVIDDSSWICDNTDCNGKDFENCDDGDCTKNDDMEYGDGIIRVAISTSATIDVKRFVNPIQPTL